MNGITAESLSNQPSILCLER